MRKALIHGERICEVRDDTFPVHPDLFWVDVADGTTEFDTYVDGEVVTYVAPELTWQQSRVAAYGSVGSQLDMQYWDGVNSTSVWSDHIAKVKSDNPKP
jgi:hypothetical protein